jgi:hypothetical protein
MPNRTAKFVLAVFASFLAGAPVSYAAAAPADECLSGPKGETPQGGHWYYRIDHPTKRHCWHLADERDPASQTAAAKPSASATPLAPETETPMQKSVANARAELPAPSAVGAAPGLTTDVVRSQDNGGVSTQGASPQQSLFASRWPNLYSAEPLTNLPPGKRDPDNEQNAASQTQPPPVIATEQFAAADMSSETPSYSLQTQLAALAGMLTLVGIMGIVIFRYNNSRQLQPGRIRTSHSPAWQSTDDDRIVLSPQRGARGFARSSDRFVDRSDRAAEFFAQISHRTPR